MIAALVAQGADAELYRCVTADGSIRFTDDPSACGRAEPYVPRRALQRPSAPAAPRADAPAPADSGWQGTHGELLSMLPSAPAGWEAVEEAPTDPRGDPDLWDNGVRTMAARHYTRARGASSQACSVEIWAFSHAERARLGESLLAQPGWVLQREGNLLIMLRAVILEGGKGPREGVFPACQQIGALARTRVTERLR